MNKLEQFLKSLLKKILSLPINAPDPALYIITGILPVEAQVDLKCLTLFNNICRQDQESLEKAIAVRQLQEKDQNSSSWFIEIKRTLMKYGLKHPLELLQYPPSKIDWKRTIKECVFKYWKTRLLDDCTMYKNLKYLNYSSFTPNTSHGMTHVDKSSDPSREAIFIAIKIKIVTGSYILQIDRAKFNTIENTQCKLCHQEPEDLIHFILKCKTLDSIRTPYLEEMNKSIQVITKNSFYRYDHTTQLQIILDCTKIENEILSNQKKRILEITADIEYISRRLCFALHSTRYRLLNIKKGKY